MNLALAIICIIGGGVALAMLTGEQFDKFMQRPMGQGAGAPVAARIAMFCGVGAMLNIALCLFNLLPCPPLDGSRIIASFSNAYRNFMQTQGGQFMSMIVFVLAFVLSGPVIFGVGMFVTFVGMGGLYALLKIVGFGP